MNEQIKPPFGSREERIAYNEDWLRQLNRRKAEWIDNGYVAAGFRCECSQPDCSVRIRLSGREWRNVRSRPNRFAVAPGHVSAEVESVVEEHPHFWIVDKQGRAGDVAEKLD